MKMLILLTSTFPYDTGEDFLNAEVQYISGFDQVLICPCNLKPDAKITKKVPKEVKVIPLKREPLGSLVYLKLLTHSYVINEIGGLLRSGKLSSGRFHEMLFFMKHAQELYHQLAQLPDIKSADEVTIYSYWFFDAAAAAALLAGELKKHGKKVLQISRAHGFDIHSERAKFSYLPMRDFLLSHVDKLYPCSQNGADTIARQFPKYAEKISPAYLGTVDYGTVKGKREPEFHLVSCAYMVPVKRLHLIVKALSFADFPIRWTHLGSGPLEEEIRKQAAGLPENVRVEFAGQIDNTAIMNFYRTHSISAFVNVSSSEGIPVSVMEASSFGIPVIATDVGGTSEAVKDGVNGFLLDKDFKPCELLEIIRLVNRMKQEEYEQLCDNARNLWEEKFNAQKNFSRFYEEISK